MFTMLKGKRVNTRERVRNMSNKFSFLAVSTVICALALSSQSVLAQVTTTVFDDTFNNGSTVDQAPVAPTANSASYEVMANQTLAVAPSIAPGDLNITQNNTSSAFQELEAQFTTSPLTLVNVGDSIDLTVTFVDTLGILRSGDTGSRLEIGLYNSGGVAPLQGALNLNSGAAFQTGGAKGWQGFLAQNTASISGNYVGVRNPQSAPNGSVQDLLFNNASQNVAFGNPLASVLANSTSATTLNQGTTNTLQLILTLTGASSMSISDTLYAGASTGGTVLYSLNGTTNGVINGFDGLAFGWRFSATAPNIKTNAMADIQEIEVNQTVVPEPSSIMLAAAGFGLMLGLVRRRRS